jgi:hypothetical protein
MPGRGEMKAIEELARLAAKIADGGMLPDEPLFVLRGKDALAGIVVREWVKIAEQHGTPIAKLTEATLLSSRMDEWEPRQIPGRPLTLGFSRHTLPGDDHEDLICADWEE